MALTEMTELTEANETSEAIKTSEANALPTIDNVDLDLLFDFKLNLAPLLHPDSDVQPVKFDKGGKNTTSWQTVLADYKPSDYNPRYYKLECDPDDVFFQPSTIPDKVLGECLTPSEFGETFGETLAVLNNIWLTERFNTWFTLVAIYLKRLPENRLASNGCFAIRDGWLHYREDTRNLALHSIYEEFVYEYNFRPGTEIIINTEKTLIDGNTRYYVSKKFIEVAETRNDLLLVFPAVKVDRISQNENIQILAQHVLQGTHASELDILDILISIRKIIWDDLIEMSDGYNPFLDHRHIPKEINDWLQSKFCAVFNPAQMTKMIRYSRKFMYQSPCMMRLIEGFRALDLPDTALLWNALVHDLMSAVNQLYDNLDTSDSESNANYEQMANWFQSDDLDLWSLLLAHTSQIGTPMYCLSIKTNRPGLVTHLVECLRKFYNVKIKEPTVIDAGELDPDDADELALDAGETNISALDPDNTAFQDLHKALLAGDYSAVARYQELGDQLSDHIANMPKILVALPTEKLPIAVSALLTMSSTLVAANDALSLLIDVAEIDFI